jgi:hypothetical protein
MQRRTFLRAGICAGLGTGMRGNGFGALLQHAEISHPIAVDPARIGHTVPANFVGLSYELAELADASFFSPANTQLVSFAGFAPLPRRLRSRFVLLREICRSDGCPTVCLSSNPGRLKT